MLFLAREATLYTDHSVLQHAFIRSHCAEWRDNRATQEYRDQLKAQVSKAAEQAKLRVRNARKTALDELKRIEKQMSKDKYKSTEKEVQTLTDKYIANIDALSKAKEKDIANF